MTTRPRNESAAAEEADWLDARGRKHRPLVSPDDGQAAKGVPAMTADDLAATLTRALDEHADWYPRSVVDDLAPTVAALIEAAEKRGEQRALTEAADALDAIRHDRTKATLARSAAGGIAPWLRRRAEGTNSNGDVRAR